MQQRIRPDKMNPVAVSPASRRPGAECFAQVTNAANVRSSGDWLNTGFMTSL